VPPGPLVLLADAAGGLTRADFPLATSSVGHSYQRRRNQAEVLTWAKSVRKSESVQGHATVTGKVGPSDFPRNGDVTRRWHTGLSGWSPGQPICAGSTAMMLYSWSA
jgi:hypothetical protein